MVRNRKLCINCRKELTGQQRKYCSKKCKGDYWRKNNPEYIKKWREENPEYDKKYHIKNKEKRHIQSKGWWLLNKYGITKEDFNILLKQQNNQCAICSKEFSKIDGGCMDHNHKTNGIRGILCINCNMGLGNFKDNPEILKKAMEYLLDYDKK